MKVKKVTIESYLSLKHVELSFNNLTIFVDKNGSGKTSVLEALYSFLMTLVQLEEVYHLEFLIIF